MEFAGELCDFVREDLKRLYPNRARAIRSVSLSKCALTSRTTGKMQGRSNRSSGSTGIVRYVSERVCRSETNEARRPSHQGMLLLLLFVPLIDGAPGDGAGGWPFVYSFARWKSDPFRSMRLEHRSRADRLRFKSFNEQNGIRSTCHRRLHESPQIEHRRWRRLASSETIPST